MSVKLSRIVGAGLVALLAFSHQRLIEAGYRCSGDEPAWITSGVLTLRLASSATPVASWDDAYRQYALNDWGNRNPPVGKLLIGLAVAPVLEPGEEVRYTWAWGRSYEENVALGRVPPRRILDAARRGIAATSVLLLLIVYLVARRLGAPRAVALAGVLVLFLVPNYEFHATHVYTDVPQLALAMAGLALLISYPPEPRFWRLAVGAGLLGASCATKFSSGAFVAGAAVALLALRRWPAPARARAAGSVCLFAAFTFVALYPYLWGNPVARTAGTIAYWQQRKLQQSTLRSVTGEPVTGIARSAALTVRRALLRPQDASPEGPRLRALRTQLSQLLLPAGALLLLALLRFRPAWKAGRGALLAAGAVAALAALAELLLTGRIGLFAIPIALGAVGQVKARRAPGGDMWLWIWLATLLLTALWLPFDWERYYLPLLVLSIPLWCAGLVELGSGFGCADRWTNAAPGRMLALAWRAAVVIGSAAIAVRIVGVLLTA